MVDESMTLIEVERLDKGYTLKIQDGNFGFSKKYFPDMKELTDHISKHFKEHAESSDED